MTSPLSPPRRGEGDGDDRMAHYTRHPWSVQHADGSYRSPSPLGEGKGVRSSLAALDPTTSSWAVVASASVVRLGRGFIASVVIARSLGPTGFGIYAVLGVVASVGGAVADVGLTSAAVKRIAAAWGRDRAAAGERASVYFWLRVGAAALFVIGATGLTSLVALARPLPLPSPWLLPLTYFGTSTTGMSAAVCALFQASGNFSGYAFVLLTNASLTALLALLLSVTGHLTLVTALLVLGSGTALAASAVGWRLLPLALRPRRPNRNTLLAEACALLRVGRWLWLGSVLAMLTAQLDVLLVHHWNNAAAVGAYALALNLASKVDVANQSLFTVLLPAVAKMDGAGATRAYLTRGLLRGSLISLAVLPLLPLSGILIPAIYGPAYAPAIGLFRLLLGVAIFDLLTTPLLVLPYRYDDLRLLAIADAVRMLTLTAIGSQLIPALGPSGAVMARMAARVAGAALVGAAIARRTSQTDIPLTTT